MGGGGGGCSLCRIINLLISLAFLGAGGYMIWYFLGQPDADEIRDKFGDFRDVLGNISNIDFGDLYDNDPFLSDNSTNSWPTSGTGGLQLEILNALDDTWQSEFDLAISDWENGNPDALTLTVSRGEVDYTCSKVDGLQKVCSGNFGDTGWLGINVIMKLQSNGEIQSSVAKMNEFYLRNAENAKRQFTMCHEIGHGFGLPHTDETFNNPSLGNCMDYTNWPEENMHPDETNFRRLASLYGTVGGRRLGRSIVRQRPKNNNHHGSGMRSIDRRFRVLSDELEREYEEAVAEIEQQLVGRSLAENGAHDSQWVLEEDHAYGSRYTKSLGEDYIIEANLLHN